jgi:glycosyltransferase involved in cell wall biosynthesis
VEKVKLWAIICCRNESDIIAYTLKHLLSQGMTGIVVADHCSTDNTSEILEAEADLAPIVVLREPNPIFHQSQIMTSLAAIAADEGADWVLCCDSDELYYCPNGHTLAEAIGALPEHIQSIGIGFHEYAVTGLDDPSEPNPYKRMKWRHHEPGRLTKIGFRYEPAVALTEGNHGVIWSGSGKTDEGRTAHSLRMAHFPYRSPEQFISKVVNSGRDLDDLSVKTSTHLREFKKIFKEGGAEALKTYFMEHFYHDNPSGLVRDPAPYGGDGGA